MTRASHEAFRFNSLRYRREPLDLAPPFAEPRVLPKVGYLPLIGEDGALYVSLTEGLVERLDRNTFAPVWSQPLARPFQPSVPFPGFLTLAHGGLFVNDHSTLVRLDLGSGLPTQLARIPEMDLRDGTAALDGFVLQYYQGSQCTVGFFHPPAWETPVWLQPVKSPSYPISAADGVCYFNRRPEEVIAVDVATGRELWSRRANAPGDNRMSGELLLVGDLVIAGFRERTVVAMKADSGSVAWQIAVPQKTPSNLAAAPDGTLYVLGASQLLRIDPATGTVLQQANLDQVLNPEAIVSVGQLEITRTHLYAAELYGKLFALDLARLELTVIAKRPAQVPFTHYPLAEPGRLWFLDGKNNLLVFPSRSAE